MQESMNYRLLFFLLIALVRVAHAEGDEVLPHFAWRSELVATGGKPEGEAAFRALQEQGITTVVNVDGSQPDLAAAKKYGLRYIHLPMGYDALSQEDLAAMRRLADEVAGKVYIHCHHGMHRGPAYAAALLRMEGKLTPEAARALLEDAGTSKDYPGLWFSGVEQPLLDIQLCAAPLPETSKTSSMIEAMVRMDDAYDPLKGYMNSGRKLPADSPDFDPLNSARQTIQALKDVRAFPEVKDAKFAGLLEASVAAGEGFAESLAAGEGAAEAKFKVFDQSCVACHKVYRNPPLTK